MTRNRGTRNRGRRSRGALLLSFAAAIVLFDAAALAFARGRTHVQSAATWVRATCGLGLGGATSPAWSLFGVDPRLEASCESERFPVPGLACPDPTHGTGVANFPARK